MVKYKKPIVICVEKREYLTYGTEYYVRSASPTQYNVRNDMGLFKWYDISTFRNKSQIRKYRLEKILNTTK